MQNAQVGFRPGSLDDWKVEHERVRAIRSELVVLLVKREKARLLVPTIEDERLAGRMVEMIESIEEKAHGLISQTETPTSRH